MPSATKSQPVRPNSLRFRHLAPFFRRRMPGQLVIQFTDRCNATCPQCEMRKTNRFTRSTLDVDDVRRTIEAAAKNGTQALSFTGGEPFLYQREVLDLGRFARDLGIPFLRTGTNGFMFLGWDKPGFERRVHELAEGLVRAGFYTFWISIDSADREVHESMRGLPGVIQGIEKALPIFRSHGLYPSANLGINRNLGGPYEAFLPDVSPSEFDPNEFHARVCDGLRRFYEFAISLGFTIVNMCYPMSVESMGLGPSAVYAASSLDRIVRFRVDEKRQLFRALLDVLPEYRHRIRIFSPASSVLALIRQYDGQPEGSYACRGGIDFFFVSANGGEAYPCGFRANDPLGKYWELDLRRPQVSEGCTACDWECFRDPSELLGPFLDLVGRPWESIRKLAGDSLFRRLWWEDLRYYRACDFFSAHRPPRYGALAKFQRRGGDSRFVPIPRPLASEPLARMDEPAAIGGVPRPPIDAPSLLLPPQA